MVLRYPNSHQLVELAERVRVTDQPDAASLSGYANGRATKQTIVASAATNFAQQGFHGASLRGIARAAGVDHSTLLHHFGNKTALLLAVLEWHDEQNMPPEMPAQLTAEMVAEGLVSVVERNRTVPGLVQLLSLLSAEAASPDHPARPALQRRHQILVTLIASVIDAQRQAGLVHDDGLSPDAGAALVVATWEGLQVYDALHPGEVDVADLIDRTLRRAFGLA